jgi:mannose/fructose/N-acetylgalactosamine-specific phosphotransferase system component IIC
MFVCLVSLSLHFIVVIWLQDCCCSGLLLLCNLNFVTVRLLITYYFLQQVLDTRGHLLVALGYGLWPSMVLISEIVQTFILADFCYYYVKRLV